MLVILSGDTPSVLRVSQTANGNVEVFSTNAMQKHPEHKLFTLTHTERRKLIEALQFPNIA